MNVDRLKQAEAEFLQRYPSGFNDPELVPILKKHNVQRMTDQSQELLAKKCFDNTGPVLDNLIKIVSRSSMVSMFEKPKFRDYINSLDLVERKALALGFKSLLHGNQKRGFNEIVDILAEGKIAKWSVMTIGLFYFRPTEEAFVKPTTTKNIIKQLELTGLEYKPRPSFEFYDNFRAQINQMRNLVDTSVAPNNAAFTGFLMMTL